VEPIGINPGDAESHLAFGKAHALNFDLLVDERAGVAQTYGAIKPDNGGIQRSVVVVGRNGKVIFAENGAPPWQRILMDLQKIDDVTSGSG
jgi:peroxiredoxin